MRCALSLLAILAAPVVAYAQPAQDQPAQPPTTPPTTPPPQAPPATVDIQKVLERLSAVEAENAALRDRVDQLEDDHKFVEDRVATMGPLVMRLSGYLDIGFFSVGGDGTGIRKDIGSHHFPEYDYVAGGWVFMGDPLATAVNSRGDPANTGESRAVTLNAIGTHAATFLVNSLNIGLAGEVGKNLVFASKLDILPRGRDVSNIDQSFLGDYLDLRLAYMEYRVHTKRMKLSLFAGKFDSTVGVEYRTQEAPTRIEVTPSLICRYTCGYPVGVKARAEWFDDAITLAVAVTNGSNTIEQFPFNDEIDTNDMKTGSGRLSFRLPFLKHLEIGASGAFGAQDIQTENDVYQWMYGVDVRYQTPSFVLRAEYVQGRAKGQTEDGDVPCGLAPCLRFKGAYALAGWRITNIVMPYIRADWRNALHRDGASFVYISDLWRLTPGLHLDVNDKLSFKAEYTLNRELGRIPQFDDDVFTTSAVIKY